MSSIVSPTRTALILLRYRIGVSQAAMAVLLHVSKSSVQKYENGTLKPNSSVMDIVDELLLQYPANKEAPNA